MAVDGPQEMGYATLEPEEEAEAQFVEGNISNTNNNLIRFITDTGATEHLVREK